MTHDRETAETGQAARTPLPEVAGTARPTAAARRAAAGRPRRPTTTHHAHHAHHAHHVHHVHRAGRYERYVKPVVDRCGAAVLLVLLLPVLVGLAVAVWASLGAPVIIRQDRIGKGGRVFGMYKLRTMHADRRRQMASPWGKGHERRVSHKRDDDPRLVPVGRFLRRWSLDELPQLVNVLIGDMSLVGPRPELAAIVAQHYQPWQHARHQVKPGVTGLWQVSARGRGLMHEHIALDLEYLRTLSFTGDLTILLRTLPSALGPRKGI